MKDESEIRVVEGFTLHVNYDYSPANTLRWARALAILARIRRRTLERQKEEGSE